MIEHFYRSSMKIRIYNAITRDGYILDKSGKHFLYFTADKEAFQKMFKSADCLLLDHANYTYLTAMKVLPTGKKFIVVFTDEPSPKDAASVWYTNLDPKQIKREIKIQGYKNVLCLVNNEIANKILAQKIATEVHVVIYHSIKGGGLEKIELVDAIQKKTTPKITAGEGFDRFDFVFKK